MNILGVSAFYHDAAACLMVDGDIIAAAQEERFTRIRHDQRFPEHAIGYCLSEAGIDASAVDYVAFYEKPFIKAERIIESYLTGVPHGFRSFVKAIPDWIKKKIWIKSIIQSKLNGFAGEVLFPEHHHAHSASAFYPSPFKQAAVLTADGAGEWATTSIARGDGHRLKLIREQRFPHSLGLLYSAFTYFAGFRVNSGEYKLMGLAPYGEPKYAARILDELIDLKEDGSFRLNMHYFDYVSGLKMTNNHFAGLFNKKPRVPEAVITQGDMDIAASIQKVTEEIMVKMARYAHQITGYANLCLAGGVALNCVANSKIRRAKIFDEIWVQPAAGDAGGALGAAYALWHQYLDQPRDETLFSEDDGQKGSFLGPAYTEKRIGQFLKQKNIPHECLPLSEIHSKTAELLAGGSVVGLFQGRMEYGPRALGARSILADARSLKMQKLLNAKIKFRESFRPFAPAILEEHVSDYFDTNKASPYMMFVAGVSGKRRKQLSAENQSRKGLEKLSVARSDIPAVTHVDFSARLQTVDQKRNPYFYALLKAFYALTGTPLLINTSFNRRGEPIVCTPEEAYQCFMLTGMDYLVLENFLIDKKAQSDKKTLSREPATLGID